MNKVQEQAWEWLRPEEQNSLYLTLGTGKSSWEVGEMMKKSHYKYLEIKERSEVLFKLFTTFLENHPSLFRPGGPCQETFIDYIEALICKRTSIREATLFSGNSLNMLPKIKSDMIRKNLIRLGESPNIWDQETLRLILEFDRWNNFRILPKMMQLPSCYKRKINKKHKIYIKYIRDLPKELVLKIKERFYFKSHKESNKYYTVLYSFDLFPESGYFVMPISKDDSVIQELSDLYLYIFKTRDEADIFGFKIANYYLQTSHVKLGLKFWPEYRDIVSRSINYNSINNLDFDTRKLASRFKNL